MASRRRASRAHHVDRREGLVEQEHPERGGECPAEGHALALAAGQRRPAGAGEGAEPEALQQLRDLTAAAERESRRRRSGDGEVGEQRRRLAHEGHLPVAGGGGGLPPRPPGDEPALDPDLAAAEAGEPGDRLEDRRLARPRGAEDGEALAGPESEPGLDGDRSALDGQVDLEQWRRRGAHGASIPATRARVRALQR